MDFTHLHLHSMYSALDGLNKIPDLCQKVKESGMDAVAITDHASMGALPVFFKEAKKYEIKPIIGCEFYVVDNLEEPPVRERRYHLLVLAKDWSGVVSLNEILSEANRHFHKRPRISWDMAMQFKNCVVSTACSAGVLSHPDNFVLVDRFKKTYGDDFYLEMMPFKVYYGEEEGDSAEIDQQEVINKKAIEYHKSMGIQLLMTNDAHFLDREDSSTHEVMLAIQRSAKMSDPNRWKFDSDDVYVKTPQEIYEASKGLEYLDDDVITQAMSNTKKISDSIHIDMPQFDFDLPTPYDGDDDEVFMSLVKKGWVNRIAGTLSKEDEDIYIDRMAYEIGVIKDMGFLRYFLIVEDIVNYAKRNDIAVGPARGSAAGSLVAYLLGITDVDPIKYELIFERFLNPERVSMPDVDMDFEHERRHEVFKYIEDKYGHDKTAKITTFTIIGSKTALRDVARTYEVKPFLIDAISKQMDEKATLQENINNVYDLKRFAEEYPNIIRHALKLEGVIRGVGIHAAGIVASSETLTNRCVVEARKDRETGLYDSVINWDKDVAEDNGLLKIDILGLKSLTIIKYALELIKARTGKDIDLLNLPMDDEKTLGGFINGATDGVFQFESGSMQQLLRDMKCDSFDKAVHATALFRPGSLESGETEKYVKISQGTDKPKYRGSDILRDILESTNGILVYQEQMMAIFHRMAGFTLAQADIMRKIVGKKLGQEAFEKHRNNFVDGCLNLGTIDKRNANDLFDKMVKFAGYSFNKSHAVAYTLISYQMMYLKAHYPLEFFTAILTYDKDGNMKKYVRDAQASGAIIDLPNVNMSESKFTIKEGRIIPPFTVIKGIGSKASDSIVQARGDIRFQDEADFLSRIVKRTVNKNVREKLALAGALRDFGIYEEDDVVRKNNYVALIESYDDIPEIFINKEKIDTNAIISVYSEVSQKCEEDEHIIFPTTSKSPTFMIITPCSKGDAGKIDDLDRVRLFWHKNTKWTLTLAKEYGFAPKHFYVTSPAKIAYKTHWPNDPNSVCFMPKDRENDYEEWKHILDREIEIVNPSAIICLSGWHCRMFLPKKPKLSSLDGNIEWSHAYNRPVLFGYSPQYCSYREHEDGMRKVFDNLRSIVNFT